jgi:hypothetical protein
VDDKTYDQTKQRTQAILNRLVDALGLGRTRFDLVFHRDPPHHNEDGATPTMEIAPNRVYGQALLSVYATSVANLDDDELAEAILHELGHYAIHPISKYGSSPEYDALEELVCTDLAVMMRSLISATGDEVAKHWRKKVKLLEKEIVRLKQGAA